MQIILKYLNQLKPKAKVKNPLNNMVFTIKGKGTQIFWRQAETPCNIVLLFLYWPSKSFIRVDGLVLLNQA